MAFSQGPQRAHLMVRLSRAASFIITSLADRPFSSPKSAHDIAWPCAKLQPSRVLTQGLPLSRAPAVLCISQPWHHFQELMHLREGWKQLLQGAGHYHTAVPQPRACSWQCLGRAWAAHSSSACPSNTKTLLRDLLHTVQLCPAHRWIFFTGQEETA